MADNGVTCSMSRARQLLEQCCHGKLVGFATLRASSLNTERIGKKVCRTRVQVKPDLFAYIECFHNPTRRHSTLGYVSPIDFGREAGVA